MSDSDKMRAEFESEARVIGLSLFPMKGKGEYWNDETNLSWRVWQAAYQAARNAVQREAEEWSKSVNKSYIETANKPEGER